MNMSRLTGARLSPPPLSSAPGSFWGRSLGVQRVGYVAGTLLIASGLIHVAILVA
jgi:hypothetical protein